MNSSFLLFGDCLVEGFVYFFVEIICSSGLNRFISDPCRCASFAAILGVSLAVAVIVVSALDVAALYEFLRDIVRIVV